ncbi:MAG: multifunctional CCA addition/repair protein [Pseudomonadota bacterium]
MSYQTYRVGGAVRDRLLGLPVVDIDWVVVGATPAELLEQGYRQVGNDFPVFLHPHSQDEYALARTERKQGSGYNGFVCDFTPEVSLEEDLQRRDLTINAMAELPDGSVIDPCGGQQDLAARLLRHVSPAFIEDPLRVLRVARFAARFKPQGFRIAPETFALMQQLSRSGELQTLTPERVWQEMSRALAGPRADVFFEVLQDCGALAVLLPEVSHLFGIPQRADYHPEVDTGLHTLLSLQQAERLTPDAAIRYAALVHDVGKGLTPTDVLPRHTGHEARGLPLIRAIGQRLRVPKAWQELALLVGEWHLDCHRATELRPDTLLRKLTLLDAWRRPDRFADFLTACEADARGRTGLEDRDYWQRDYWLGAHVATQVDMPTLIAQGLQGADMANAIAALRLSQLSDYRQRYRQQHPERP